MRSGSSESPLTTWRTSVGSTRSLARPGEGTGAQPPVASRVARSGLRGDNHLAGNPGKPCDQILSVQRGLPRGAARHKAQPVETGQPSNLEPQIGDSNVGALQVHPL